MSGTFTHSKGCPAKNNAETNKRNSQFGCSYPNQIKNYTPFTVLLNYIWNCYSSLAVSWHASCMQLHRSTCKKKNKNHKYIYYVH